MFELSFGKLLIILVVVLLIFGKRLPGIMGDLGKGLRHFKDALSDNPQDEAPKVETKDKVEPKKDA